MRRSYFALLTCLMTFSLQAQNLNWWDALHDYPNAAGPDRSRYVSISPGFMGPNALRVPALTNGIIDNELWTENTVEYHSGNGDQTLDIWSQFNIPLAKDKAVLYVTSIPLEWWWVTEETRDERRMQRQSGQGWNSGDLAFGIILRLANEEKGKLPNITFRAHSKTTTGGNITNARSTDGSMFFWESTISKTIAKTETSSLLIKGMIGFYTWQTNRNFLPNGSDQIQNDAGVYGVGIEWTKGKFKVGSDVSGYHGYISNRDYPTFWRNQFSYRISKHIALYSNVNIGLKKWDWNTVTIGYRHFFKTID